MLTLREELVVFSKGVSSGTMIGHFSGSAIFGHYHFFWPTGLYFARQRGRLQVSGLAAGSGQGKVAQGRIQCAGPSARQAGIHEQAWYMDC